MTRLEYLEKAFRAVGIEKEIESYEVCGFISCDICPFRRITCDQCEDQLELYLNEEMKEGEEKR